MNGSRELSEHKRRVAAVYNLAAAGYDKPAMHFFLRAATHLVQFAEIQSGQTILDAATGTGAAAIAAARVVGPTGRVVGVDIAKDMLEQARRNVAAAGLTNIELREGDAEYLPFEDHNFDTVICASSIFFLADMVAGLREWRRVAKSGG
ncbi:MAG: class I SAM-dependent methyltransferase [Candidatus Methylomirabilia bacterium]